MQFDPPEPEPPTADSIRRAKEDANAERTRINEVAGTSIPLHPMPEFHPVEDIERPLGNCLADGMLLPPSRICNFCGRDNN